MRLGVLSDLHGNIEALDAVMKDLSGRSVEGIICLGDLVGYGPKPNEVVERVAELEIQSVVGNYDLAVAHPNAEEALARYLKTPVSDVARRTYEWTREKTAPETCAYLRDLPATFWIEEGDETFLFVHGSPEAPNEYLTPETGEGRLAELLRKTGATVLLAGHTHLPMARRVEGGVVLNPGSVGRPKDGDPRASYLILDTEKGFRVEHIRVTFDVESVAKDCVISGLPREQADGLRLGLSKA